MSLATAQRRPALYLNSMRQRDPARILGVKFRLVRQFNRRFAELKRAIAKSIVENDCFGIQANAGAPVGIVRANIHLDVTPAIPGRAFQFETSARKIAGFMDWLRKQEEAGILDIIVRPGMAASNIPSWSDVYVRSFYVKSLREAYEKGIQTGRYQLGKAGYPMGSEVPGAPMQFLMQQPIHVERIGLIYSRTFEDLRTVLDVTNARIRRQIADGLTTGLARGMAEGKGPMQIARELVKDVIHHVDVIGINRARMIARTEVARAHHLATMAEYRLAGVEGIRIKAEILTSGLPNVCPLCHDLVKKEYTLDEAEALLPVHPSCACTSVPVVKAA